MKKLRSLNNILTVGDPSQIYSCSNILIPRLRCAYPVAPRCDRLRCGSSGPKDQQSQGYGGVAVRQGEAECARLSRIVKPLAPAEKTTRRFPPCKRDSELLR